MTEAVGIVISVHRLGATVRLLDGRLAAVPLAELHAHHAAYAASFTHREPLTLAVEPHGRHSIAFISRGTAPGTPPVSAVAPSHHDSVFEEQMRRYLKATEEWARPDRPAPADRHFIRKKRRAAHFEARAKGT